MPSHIIRVALQVLVMAVGLIGLEVTTAHGQPPEAPDPESVEGVRFLLNPEHFNRDWTFYSADRSLKLEDTWKIEQGEEETDHVLICLGEPFGYIRTVANDYENFELGLEWKYPTAENGNSGILIHTADVDKIWPQSIQIQLHRPTAGSIFPNEGAKTDNTKQVTNFSRPVNQWNRCVIHCENGRISAIINGRKVGEVTGCVPRKGSIAFQSEGAEVHFRKIWLKRLQSKSEPAKTPMQTRTRLKFESLNAATPSWSARVDVFRTQRPNGHGDRFVPTFEERLIDVPLVRRAGEGIPVNKFPLYAHP